MTQRASACGRRLPVNFPLLPVSFAGESGQSYGQTGLRAARRATPFGSDSGETARVLEQKDQCARVVRNRLKAEVPVKRLRLSVQGMGQQRAYACMLGNGDGTPDRILQKTETQAAFLVIEGVREARILASCAWCPSW